MNLTRQLKEELNGLSKEVFGASSRWQKLVTNGYVKPVTREEEEIVPAEKAGDLPTTRTVQVPVKRADGAPLSTTEHHTVESIHKYMLDRKAQLELIRAEIKRQQDAARAKREQEKLANTVHQELAGSAV